MQARLQSVLSRLSTIPVPEEANLSMSKRISMYGAYERREPVWQRYWKRRKDGVKQRYWKKTKRRKKVVRTDGRYEFEGRGRDLRKAIALAHHYVPRDFIEVSAKEFLDDPKKFGEEGVWIAPIIQS